MCDYSLMHVKSRAASVGDKLRTTNFGTGTRGFAGVDDPTTAVCVLPGTELAFDSEIRVYGAATNTPFKTAIFRQITHAAVAAACRVFELLRIKNAHFAPPAPDYAGGLQLAGHEGDGCSLH